MATGIDTELRVQRPTFETTNATPVVGWVAPLAGSAAIGTVQIEIRAFAPVDGTAKRWRRSAVIKKFGGVLTVVGAESPPDIPPTGVLWDIAIAKITDNSGIQITFTGDATKTVNWYVTPKIDGEIITA
jgi:hypothetical protein